MPVSGSYLLFRVDDRLLHGQVTIGWGLRLGPTRYLIVDDRVAGDPLSRALYAAAAPEGAELEVWSLSEAMAAEEGGALRRRTILLVRDLATAAALLRHGWPGPLNLGGIHAHEEAVPLLPYVHLTPEERELLAELVREGYAVMAQDLPETTARPAAEILGSRRP